MNDGFYYTGKIYNVHFAMLVVAAIILKYLW